MALTLRRYQERLIDFSTKNNPSIFLSAISDKNYFDSCRLLSIDSSLPPRILTEKSLKLVPLHPQDDEVGLLSKSLKSLYKEIDGIEKETGRNAFYIACGLLEGYLTANDVVRAPLFFIPARIKKMRIEKTDYLVIERLEDEQPFLNRSLVAMIKHLRKIDLGNFPEVNLDGDLEKILPSIQTALKDLGIEATLDSDSFVEPFEKILKNEAEKRLLGTLRIRSCLILGKFHQSSGTLLKDYDQIIANPTTSGLFASLTGIGTASNEHDLDFTVVKKEETNRYSTAETYFVDKTDASQEAAILASRERSGLIIQGPPGTGKSQVIVNLVVDRLMRNQRVLVVCQKSVALQVVHNRLGSIGINRHAALVAKTSEDRQQVLEVLLSLLEQEETTDYPEASSALAAEIDRIRDRLDSIARGLHKKRSCGRTLRWLYTHTINRQDSFFDVKDLRGISTEEELEQEAKRVYEITRLASKHDRSESPWSKRKSFAAAIGEHEIRSLLSELLRLVSEAGGSVSEELFEKSELAARLMPYQDVLADKNALAELLALLESLAQASRIAKALRHLAMADKFLEQHLDTKYLVHEKDEKVLRSLLKNSDWVRKNAGSWLRYLHPLRKRRESMVEQAMLEHAVSTPHELAKGTVARIALLKAEQQLEGAGLFSYCPAFNTAKEASVWIRRSTHLLEFASLYEKASTELSEHFRPLTSLPQDSNAATESVRAGLLVEEAKRRLPELQKYLQDGDAETILRSSIASSDGKAQLWLLLDSLAGFEEMKRLDALRKEANEKVTGELLKRCETVLPMESEAFSPEIWSELVRNSFRHRWITEAEEEDPQVRDVSLDVFDEMRTRFQGLLEKKREETPRVLQSVLAKRTSTLDPKRRHTLKHEAGKKGRGKKTLRQLLNEYQEEFFELFPIWLCTPDTVSSLFPLKDGMFDLVIFDEASQLPVENALPAIHRAKQVVVAGDEMQLPPMDYFKAAMEDDEDEEDPAFKSEDDRFAKSLLDWCKPKMASVWLTSHYRSNHDALINFSNHAFYAGRMDTATPAKKGSEAPIRFIKSDGRWLGGENRKEAERVASLVLEILRDDPSNPTIGVITMNDKQAKLIDSLLDALGAADPEAHYLVEAARNRKDGNQEVDLFVKNIENVQGDERDVIIFSATYAEDEKGKMPSHFGTGLSSDIGGNIVNVAVTRAKERVYVVCSFAPSQWTQAETYKNGVRLYKRYLEYAMAVSEGDEKRVEQILNGLSNATTVQDSDEAVRYDSPFEKEVREAILELGYRVHTQVGYSGYRIDLGIVSKTSPSTYLLGVECDGAMYHSSKVARERDYYRQKFLEAKGWRIHRIWSRNWWRNREEEMRKLQELIGKLENFTDEDECRDPAIS